MVFKKVFIILFGVSINISNLCNAQSIVSELIDWAKFSLAKNEVLHKQDISIGEINGLWQISGHSLEYRVSSSSNKKYISHILIKNNDAEILLYHENIQNKETLYSEITTKEFAIKFENDTGVSLNDDLIIFKSAGYYFIKNKNTNKSKRMSKYNRILNAIFFNADSLIGDWTLSDERLITMGEHYDEQNYTIYNCNFTIIKKDDKLKLIFTSDDNSCVDFTIWGTYYTVNKPYDLKGNNILTTVEFPFIIYKTEKNYFIRIYDYWGPSSTFPDLKMIRL